LDNSKEAGEALAYIEERIKVFRQKASKGECNPEWVGKLENAFKAAKEGDFKAIIELALFLAFLDYDSNKSSKRWKGTKRNPEETGGENGRFNQ
jgi:hypothetical protein